MELHEDIGKIYDTIFYCVEYFNHNTLDNIIPTNNSLFCFADNCYKKINEKVSSLPTILEPFFITRESLPCAMTSFFFRHVNFISDTFDSFLIKITASSNDLYNMTVNYLLSDKINDSSSSSLVASPDTLMQALESSMLPDSQKLHISFLAGNLSYAVALLVHHLREIYIEVNNLHAAYADELRKAADSVTSEQTLQLYSDILRHDLTEAYDKTHFAVSLLNPYIIRSISKNEYTEVLFGVFYENYLKSKTDEDSINLRHFFIALGNDTRLSVLQALTEHKELTATMAAKIVDQPVATVLRHIDVLYENNILYISKRKGLNIFYKINYEILIRAFNIINNKLGGIDYEKTNREQKGTNMVQTQSEDSIGTGIKS